MGNYIKYVFKVPAQKQELVIGWLSQYDFEAYEEKPDSLLAYMDEAIHKEETPHAIRIFSNQMSISFDIERVPAKNWNAVWEANFEPITIDDFCYIRAPFHPERHDIKHCITITPKMAFGTGHHATTYMMMQLMERVDFEQKTVFDYGCGTGILAILASKLGAKEGVAIDIEQWATENTQEHFQHHNVHNISIQTGNLSIVPSQSFDVILANINRNVILDSLPILKGLLHQSGTMLLSGILMEDLPTIEKALAQESFSIVEKKNREAWIALMVGHDPY